jgi:prevent-host-death family protein
LTKLTNAGRGQYDVLGCSVGTKTVNLYEAKTQLSRLVDEVAAGGEVVIAKAGVPRARLVPLRAARRARTPGRFKGRIRIASDFDAPLPPGLLSAFFGDDGRS